MLPPWKKSYDKPRWYIKKQRYHNGLYSQSYGFPSSHLWMWELGHEEGWAPKNWCFQTEVLEKTFESPLDRKEIKAVNPKGNQPWLFTERTDAEAPILWPPNSKNWLVEKYPDAGKDWRQEGKGVSEGEIFGWHLWFYWYEFEQTPSDSEGQRILASSSPWGHKQLDMTEQLNWTELNWIDDTGMGLFLGHFVPLMYVSISMPGPFCFDYYSL